ncbi:protein kinase [Luedemannella flava]
MARVRRGAGPPRGGQGADLRPRRGSGLPAAHPRGGPGRRPPGAPARQRRARLRRVARRQRRRHAVRGDGAHRRPFAERRATRGPLPWPQAAAIVAQVAAGLAAAHARGLVHRDVKPANIVLAPTGAKLVDFGISAIAGEAEESGEVLGTPAYLAPERIIGRRTSPAADVYALGLLLYRAVAGDLPWSVAGPTELLLAHLEVDPRPLPDATDETLPDALIALCERCLVKEPDERPSAAAVAQELIALPGVAGATIPGAEPTRPTEETEQTAFLAAPLAVRRAAGRAGVPASGPRDPAGATATAVDDQVRGRWWGPVAAGVASVAIVGVMAGAAALGDDVGTGQAAPPSTSPSAASCQAIYRMRSDDGRRFAGEVTVLNTGTVPLRDWTLSFHYQGDQRVAGQDVHQSGRAVSIGPVGRELPAGKETTYAFRGTYRKVNPMPLEFAVDAVPCTARLVGPVAAPTPTAAPEKAKPQKDADDAPKPPKPAPPGQGRKPKP